MVQGMNKTSTAQGNVFKLTQNRKLLQWLHILQQQGAQQRATSSSLKLKLIIKSKFSLYSPMNWSHLSRLSLVSLVFLPCWSGQASCVSSSTEGSSSFDSASDLESRMSLSSALLMSSSLRNSMAVRRTTLEICRDLLLMAHLSKGDELAEDKP